MDSMTTISCSAAKYLKYYRNSVYHIERFSNARGILVKPLEYIVCFGVNTQTKRNHYVQYNLICEIFATVKLISNIC